MAVKPGLVEARKFFDQIAMSRYGWLPAELQIGLHALHTQGRVTTPELRSIGKNLVALAAHKEVIIKELMPRAASLHKAGEERGSVELLLRHSASEAALLSLVTPKLRVELHHGFACDIGQERDTNEDFVLVDPKKQLYVVADGMGGHADGEVAAREASVKTAQAFNGGKRRELVRAVQAANTHVHGLNQQRRGQYKGDMGTTLTALHIDPEGEAHIAHVGDTRVYLHRPGPYRHGEQMPGHIMQLTLDQSHPVKQNVLWRTIGHKENVTPHSISVDTESGDNFLLCSDGLNKHVTDEEIRKALDGEEHPQAIADRLVALANRRGGRDNIAAIVVKVIHKK